MEHELERLLSGRRARRPRMQAQDYYKLLYQRAFGCEHMAPAPESAAALLQQEYAAAHGLAGPQALAEAAPGGALPGAVEALGGGLCRVFLDGAWTRETLRLLGRCFCATAAAHRGDAAAFAASLEFLCQWAARTLPCAEAAALRQTVERLRAGGLPAVHHSDAFRAAYAPHYRVVCRRYADAWPALLAAQRAMERAARAGRPALLAIDGRCGAGKSTLAGCVAEVLGCPVFHLDDFFLPPALRTPERLARPGENVHHERFLREVLRPFAAGREVRFCPFDCAAGAPGPQVCVPAAPFAAVEGSYALHPALRGFYAASVFVTCAPQTQRARLAAREGAESLALFETRWIPLEEAYFQAYGVPALADVVLDTTRFSPAQA